METDCLTDLADERCIFRVPFLMLVLIFKIFLEFTECRLLKKVIQDDLKIHTDRKSEGRLGVYAENRTYVVVLKPLAVE
jgi:hypothetical protein